MTLCIRLFSELVQERYSIPLPQPSDSLLAAHANALLKENIDLFNTLGRNHRSEAFNSVILPQSQAVIEAIGQALAYAEAARAGVPQSILDVYQCAAVRQDAAWYSEEGYLSRMQQRMQDDKALTAFLPGLSMYLDQLSIEKYVTAPIVSDAAWKAYLPDLPSYDGHTYYNDWSESLPVLAML